MRVQSYVSDFLFMADSRDVHSAQVLVHSYQSESDEMILPAMYCCDRVVIAVHEFAVFTVPLPANELPHFQS